MTDSLETLKMQHHHSLALLRKLTEFLKTGAAFGMRVDATLDRKIERALRNAAGTEIAVDASADTDHGARCGESDDNRPGCQGSRQE
jgi:hypothetical protein